MAQDTLAEILGVEKEIRERLDAERQQASIWLEQARRDIEKAHQAARERFEREGRSADDVGAAAAREAAATAVREAEEAARALGQLRDDTLRPLVRRAVAAILPDGPS